MDNRNLFSALQETENNLVEEIENSSTEEDKFDWADDKISWDDIYKQIHSSSSFFEKNDNHLSGFTEVKKKKTKKIKETVIYIICRDCKQGFDFTEEEMNFFTSKGWPNPKSCFECRKSRKQGFVPQNPQRKKTIALDLQ